MTQICLEVYFKKSLEMGKEYGKCQGILFEGISGNSCCDSNFPSGGIYIENFLVLWHIVEENFCF